MRKTHHTPNQIVIKLIKVEATRDEERTIVDAVRNIGVTEQTYYRWKQRYGLMDRDQLQRLKDLEKENKRLKKLSPISPSTRIFLRRRLRENTESDLEASRCSPRSEGPGCQRTTSLLDARLATLNPAPRAAVSRPRARAYEADSEAPTEAYQLRIPTRDDPARSRRTGGQRKTGIADVNMGSPIAAGCANGAGSKVARTAV